MKTKKQVKILAPNHLEIFSLASNQRALANSFLFPKKENKKFSVSSFSKDKKMAKERMEKAEKSPPKIEEMAETIFFEASNKNSLNF